MSLPHSVTNQAEAGNSHFNFLIFPKEGIKSDKASGDIRRTKLTINPKFSFYLKKGQMYPPSVILKVDLSPHMQEREGAGLEKDANISMR